LDHQQAAASGLADDGGAPAQDARLGFQVH
jgi:hypothetical protein